MRDLSIKPEVQPLDLKVGGEQVFVRQLTAGEATDAAERVTALAGLSKGIKPGEEGAEAAAESMAASLTAEQRRILVSLKKDELFVRWCNADGVRRFTDRAEFDAIPQTTVQAVIDEMVKLDPTEADAEGNSETPIT